MIRALIFDYFDVIRQPGNGLRSAYRRLGGDTVRDETFIADVTTAANLGFIDNPEQQLADHLGVTLEQWRHETKGANVNDQELLSFIREKRTQGYKTGLLTNTGPHTLQTYFEPQELAQTFDAWLTSGDTGYAKPEAAFYRMMADRLGVQPEECVMIDDRPEFCEGARYIGMQAIVYKDFSQLKPQLEKLLEQS